MTAATSTPSTQGTDVETIIVGGQILAGSGDRHRADISLAGGRIAAIAPTIEAPQARSRIDATGLIVTPGLVDAHTHLFPSGSFWGMDPSGVVARSGVTTWIDAGSAGAFTFPAFVAGTAHWTISCFALVNISVVGLAARTGESTLLEWCDETACESVIAAHRGRIVGIKVRVDHETVGINGDEPLRRALRVAERTDLPVMVHIGEGPPEIDIVLDLLRPGDVVTHFATRDSMRLLDSKGTVRPQVREARQRGVLFDLGHGGGSFGFEIAERLAGEGFFPDLISTDLHAGSLANLDPGLTNCMSKLLALGMTPADIVAATTVRPARAFGLPEGIGTLRIGAPADLALLELADQPVTLHDAYGTARLLSRSFTARATIKNGQLLDPQPEVAPMSSADRPNIGRTRGDRR